MVGIKSVVVGVGVNDVKYKTTGCPFYIKWKSMLERCYMKGFKSKYSCYQGVEVCDNWKIFSNFKSWMETQDWEGKEIDKDLLGDGNLYSEENCCFISKRLNNFLINSRDLKNPNNGTFYREERGKWLGILYYNNDRVILGSFLTQEQANRAWRQAKHSAFQNEINLLKENKESPKIISAVVLKMQELVDLDVTP